MRFLRSIVFLLAAVAPIFAQNAPLHVLVSNGMKAVILELQPKAEKTTGPLIMEFGTTTSLQKKAESGAPFDVAIMTSEAVSTLAKENKITAATRTNLSRSGIGLAVRTGAPKPDISTPDALKKALLDAKTVSWAGDGASRPHLDQMIEKLGIATQVKPKLVLTQGSSVAMQKVAAGQIGMVLTLMSELKPIAGIDIAGPLPEQLQGYVEFAAGVSSQSSNAQAARNLISVLTGPGTAPIYTAKGMEPMVVARSAKK